MQSGTLDSTTTTPIQSYPDSFSFLAAAIKQYEKDESVLGISKLLNEEKKDSSENKTDTPSVVSSQSWVDYDTLQIHTSAYKKSGDQLAINEKWYNLFGIIVLAAPYNTSTHASAAKFITDSSIIMGNVTCKYGDRETIIEEMGWKTDQFARSDRLLSQLQSIADETDPKLVSSARTECKNTNAIFALTKPPTPYLPLILQNGLFLTDNYSLRIHPSVSKKHPFQPKRFEKFTLSLFMFGSSSIGQKASKNHFFENVSLMTEAADLPVGQKILQMSFSQPSFCEESQFKSLNIIALMMVRLGVKGCEVVCNLHDIDYLLHALLLYFNEKINLSALEIFIEKIITRKETTEKRLREFFSPFNIKLSFASSLNNLFDYKHMPAQNRVEYLMSKLQLQDRYPDADENNDLALIGACKENLIKDNPDLDVPYPDHRPVWNDFETVLNNNKIALTQLSEFLIFAEAVTLAIATQKTPAYKPYDVCSIEYGSRKNIQNTFNAITRIFDTKKLPTAYLYHGVDPKYPQRSAVNYSKIIPQPFTKTSTTQCYYPSLFFISVFDLWIAKNLSENPDEDAQSSATFNFKDTRNANALSLARHAAFFKDASRNGAYRAGDPEHRALRRGHAG